MIARCEVCRGFVEVARTVGHPARVGAHFDRRMVKVDGYADEAAAEIARRRLDAEIVGGRHPQITCSGGGREARPLLAFFSHPIAGDAVNVERLRRIHPNVDRYSDEGRRSAHLQSNLGNAEDWYRWALAAMPHVDVGMPWRPLLDVLPEDGGAGRKRGLQISTAMAARFDVMILVVRATLGVTQETRALRATGGLVADLTDLGPAPPALGAVVNLPDVLAD